MTKNPNPSGPLSKPQTPNGTGSRAMIIVVGTLSLIIISSLTSPVGARSPSDRCGRHPQSRGGVAPEILRFSRQTRQLRHGTAQLSGEVFLKIFRGHKYFLWGH